MRFSFLIFTYFFLLSVSLYAESSYPESRGRLSANSSSRLQLGEVVASISEEPVTNFELRTSRQSPKELLKARLIEKEAKAHQIEVSSKMVDAYIEKVRGQNGLSEEDFMGLLSKKGYTKESYKAEIRQDILKSQLVSKNVVSKMQISNEDIIAYLREKNNVEFGSGDKFIRRYDYACSAGFSLGESSPEYCSPEDEKYFSDFRDAIEAKNIQKLRSLSSKLRIKVVELGFVKSSDLKEEISKLVVHMDSGVSAPFFEAGHLRAFQVLGSVDEFGEISGPVMEEARKQIISSRLKEAEKEYFEKELPQKHNLVFVN